MTELFENSAELAAQTALDDCPIYLLRQLGVKQIEDVIEITGIVDSFYHKQLAQEIVRLVCNGNQVVNRVDVDPTC